MITSTFGTIYKVRRKEPYTYSERDDNEDDPRAFEAGDREPTTVYHASKIAAEKGMAFHVSSASNS